MIALRNSWLSSGLPALVLALAAATAAAPPEGAGVELDAPTRERIGLRLAPLAAAQVQPAVEGFGHVLDPALLAAPVYDHEAAQAAADAARHEFERVERLARANENASRRDLESARAAWAREQAALASAGARLVATWGPLAARRNDLATLARTLIAREAAVVRIDLPLGTPLADAPTGGRLRPLAAPDTDTADATLLGVAADVDPTVQGRGFLLLAPHAPWAAGTAVDAWLDLPGPPRTGVTVPASALLRHAGETWVYVQSGDGRFVRRVAHPGRQLGDGWFVDDPALAPGEPVVVTGAQLLLSMELGGGAAED